MSFWNYLSEIALLNVIRDWFSCKPKYSAQQFQPAHNYACAYYCLNGKDEFMNHNRYSAAYNDDVDDLEARIDELENELADCDLMSERYDRIQSQIDKLQDQLERFEEKEEAKGYRDDDEYLCNSRVGHHIPAADWDDDF